MSDDARQSRATPERQLILPPGRQLTIRFFSRADRVIFCDTVSSVSFISARLLSVRTGEPSSGGVNSGIDVDILSTESAPALYTKNQHFLCTAVESDLRCQVDKFSWVMGKPLWDAARPDVVCRLLCADGGAFVCAFRGDMLSASIVLARACETSTR